MIRDLFEEKGATLDPTLRYRYRLWRRWGDGPRVLFVMVNPSTADETAPDPTITRCIGFGKSMGAGSIEVVNLFALRDKDVRALLMATDPVGPENDMHIEAALVGAGIIIAAWGAKTGRIGKIVNARAARVLEIITASWDAHALRITDGGHPEHPLFLPGSLRPVLYRAKKAPDAPAA